MFIIENMIIRAGTMADARGAAMVHSIAAHKAYEKLHTPKILQEHFGEQILSEFWAQQIRNSINCPQLYKVIVAEDVAQRKISGVCLAAVANKEHNGHIVPMIQKTGRKIANLQDTVIGNISTVYFHPDCQRHGMGVNFMHNVVKSEIFQGSDLFVTETLNGYEISPRFFKQFGAINIGQVQTATSKHYGRENEGEDDSVILQVWLMQKSNIINTCNDKFGNGTPRIREN
ncbi:MAG: hypothetical protein FWG18_03410 [Alphaproteobacteria bacterium]|nr:hypothetical protein [Alphaproteobacteria bacterium]